MGITNCFKCFGAFGFAFNFCIFIVGCILEICGFVLFKVQQPAYKCWQDRFILCNNRVHMVFASHYNRRRPMCRCDVYHKFRKVSQRLIPNTRFDVVLAHYMRRCKFTCKPILIIRKYYTLCRNRIFVDPVECVGLLQSDNSSSLGAAERVLI